MGEMSERNQKVQTFSYKINKSWGYNIESMATIVNNTVLYILKLLRQYILEVLITRKRMLTRFVITIYTNIKLLYP